MKVQILEFLGQYSCQDLCLTSLSLSHSCHQHFRRMSCEKWKRDPTWLAETSKTSHKMGVVFTPCLSLGTNCFWQFTFVWTASVETDAFMTQLFCHCMNFLYFFSCDHNKIWCGSRKNGDKSALFLYICCIGSFSSKSLAGLFGRGVECFYVASVPPVSVDHPLKRHLGLRFRILPIWVVVQSGSRIRHDLGTNLHQNTLQWEREKHRFILDIPYTHTQTYKHTDTRTLASKYVYIIN